MDTEIEQARTRTAEELLRGVGIDPEQHGRIHVFYVLRILKEIYQQGVRDGQPKEQN